MPDEADLLRERIQSVFDGDDHLWQRDYLGRKWLAIFAADATFVADWAAKVLDNQSYTHHMPTTTGSSRSTSSTDVQTGGSQTQTITAEELALQLDNSQSSVVYVDMPGMDDTKAAAMLLGKPPLHVEHDAVRDKWAVRKATDDEVAEAQAAAEAPSESASSA